MSTILRILIYSTNYAPEVTSTGKYIGEMGEWLAKRDHQVRVVTTPPYYPAWQVAEGYSNWAYRREQVAGTDVWRCPLWVPSRPSGTKRLFHLTSFAASSLPVMLAGFLATRRGNGDSATLGVCASSQSSSSLEQS